MRKAADTPARWWLRFPDEAAACVACGSPRLRHLRVIAIPRDARGRRVSFVTGCASCGLVFSNPPRPQEDLAQYYSPGGAWTAAQETRIQTVADRQRKALRREGTLHQPKRSGPRDRLLDALAPFVPINNPPAGSRVLDFGCGDGKFLDRLQDRGWETFGIEPSMDLAFARHRRLDAPPQDGSFDLVVLHQVLEHVPNPLAVLRSLAGSLREGGVMFVSVPNLDTVAQHRDLHYCINAKTHVVAFTETCMRALFARSGIAFEGRLDEGLHAVLTEGKPLRLRVVGRRGPVPAAPQAPLQPAVRALREYQRSAEPAAGFRRLLPVRTQAALLARARAQSRRRGTGASAAPRGMTQPAD
jgi:SAM-dependent methyltransferase